METFSEEEIKYIIQCLDNIYVKNENQNDSYDYLCRIQTSENILKIFNLLIQNQNQYMVLYLSNTLSILLKRYFIGLQIQQKMNMLNILIDKIKMNLNFQIQKQFIWLFALITRLSFYDNFQELKNLILNLTNTNLGLDRNILLNILCEICEIFKDSTIPPIDKFNRIIYFFNSELKYFILGILLEIISYNKDDCSENIAKCFKILNSEIEESDLNKKVMLNPIFINSQNKNINLKNECISICQELIKNEKEINLEIVYQIVLFNKNENEIIKKIAEMILTQNFENIYYISKILSLISENITITLNGEFYKKLMQFSVMNFSIEIIMYVLKIIYKLDWNNSNDDLKILYEYIFTIYSKISTINLNEIEEYLLDDFIKIISKFSQFVPYFEILMNFSEKLDKNFFLKVEIEALKNIKIIDNIDLFCNILINFSSNFPNFNSNLKLKFIKYIFYLLTLKDSTENIFNYICQKNQISSPTIFICNFIDLLFNILIQNSNDSVLCNKIIKTLKKGVNQKIYSSKELGYLKINSDIFINSIENQINYIILKSDINFKIKIDYLSLLIDMHLIINDIKENIIISFFQNDNLKSNQINYLIFITSLIKAIRTTDYYSLFITNFTKDINIIINVKFDIITYKLIMKCFKEITNNSLSRIDFRKNQQFRDYYFMFIFQYLINNVYQEISSNSNENILRILFKIINITSNIISSNRFINKYNENDIKILEIWEIINSILERFQIDILISYNSKLKNFPCILKFLLNRKFETPKQIPICFNILYIIYENLDSLNNILSIYSYELLTLLEDKYLNNENNEEYWKNIFQKNKALFFQIILKFMRMISNKEITKIDDISISLSNLLEIYKNDNELQHNEEFLRFITVIFNGVLTSTNSLFIKNNIINFLNKI